MAKGEHLGYLVLDRGSRWEARAWDPTKSKYLYKSFRKREHKEAAARSWAKKTHAAILWNLDQAGRATPTDELAREYLQDLRDRGFADRHCLNVRAVLIGTGHHATDRPCAICGQQFRAERRNHVTCSRPCGAQLVWLKRRKQPLPALATPPPEQDSDEPTPGSLAYEVPDLGSPRAYAQMARWWALAQENRTPVTANRWLRTVRAMVHWDARRPPTLRRLLLDPSGDIRQLKVASKVPKQFTIDELWRMACADGDPYYLRWALRLYAGLRGSEIEGGQQGKYKYRPLEWTDIDIAGRVILVDGKGQKERIVTICGELMSIITNFPREKREGFVIDKPVKGSRTRVMQFRGFLDRCGVPLAGRKPHSLRHCYAGLMTASGIPTSTLQALMGHSKEKTTSDYAQMATRYMAVTRDWPRWEIVLRRCVVGQR